MKIAIDGRIINSGTGRYIEELVRHLEKIDKENHYLLLVREKDRNYYKPTNPNFKIVVAEFADYSFSEQLGFNTFLRGLQPDLVHFCMPQQPLLFTGPVVTTVHDLNLLRITSNDDMSPAELIVKKAIFAVLLWVVAKRSKHIITPSQFTKDDLVKFSRISPRKVSVTLEGSFEVLSKPKSLPYLKGKKFLLYVGRAEPYKNNRRLIQAHQILLKTHPGLRLVIAGKKDILRHADERWVKTNGHKNIDFTDFIPNEQLAWLYKNCQVCVTPSLMEGFGLPGLEAMAHGAPVASSNTTSQPEIYGEAAAYFNPLNTEDMARTITHILDNPTFRDTLIKKGEVQYKKYSWHRMAEQTLHIYKRTLKTLKTD